MKMFFLSSNLILHYSNVSITGTSTAPDTTEILRSNQEGQVEMEVSFLDIC